MLATNASAYDFAVKNADGVMIYYNFGSNEAEACVTNKTNADNDYSGSVVIPEEITYDNKTLKVTGIGENAFYNCKALTSITIPKSVTSIGNTAFGSCSALTSIVVEKNNSKYDSRNNCNAIIETNSNTLIAGCKNSVIPNDVTSIGKNAFYCSSLTSITIPNSVTSIGEAAFFNCKALTSITIPNSVTSIGRSAFSSCSALTSIVIEKNNPQYDSRNNCNAIIETNSNTLIAGCKNTIIPNDVTSIGDKAFYCSQIENITIPNSVTSIGKNAFYWSSLTSITIPNSVTSIEYGAFMMCSSLESVTIGNSVTSIGDEAFKYCTSLKTITSKIAKPFAINEDTFDNYDVTLYVPKGTVTTYKATEGWKEFTNILEEGTATGIYAVEADNTPDTSKGIYNLNGMRMPTTSLDELPSGIYIVNGKKVVK